MASSAAKIADSISISDERLRGTPQPKGAPPGRVLASHLQALMGRGGTSWEYAEQATGHRQATLRAIADTERQPVSIDAALRLMQLGGAPLINAVLNAIGYGWARPLNPGLASAHDVLGDTAAVMCELGHALADGRLDHREEAAVADAIREALPTLKSWLADYDRRRGS